MVTAEERQGLEEIRIRRRNAKLHALGFVGICILGGIPTSTGPIAFRPAGFVIVLLAAGVLYHMSGLLMVKVFRARCPRCKGRFFAPERGSITWRLARSMWSSRCYNCGLGLDQPGMETS